MDAKQHAGAEVPPKEPTSGPAIGPRTFLKLFDPRYRKAAFILLYAMMVLTYWRYLSPAPQLLDRRFLASSAFAETISAESPAPEEVTLKTFLAGEKRTFSAFLLMGLIPALLVKFLFKENPRDYGIALGNRFTIRSILLFTPVVVGITYLGSAPAYRFIYPYNPGAALSPTLFWLHSLLLLLFYYTGWEFFFRGFMLHGLIPSCGLINAILISTMASAMLHYGHPISEVFGAVGVGLFWGLLARRTESILSGIIQHSAVGIAINWFILH
ncbi:MAG: CPBP family intramembrane metalloprotease [Thermoguttaceae bacterium]|nr:CPBP family intramembrane metalloprotease [Thermoguttaceae bacterium]